MKNVNELRMQIDDPDLKGFPAGIFEEIELKTWSSMVNESVVNVKSPPEVPVFAPDPSISVSILLIITIIKVLTRLTRISIHSMYTKL